MKQGYEYAIANPNESAQLLHKIIPDTDLDFLVESQVFLSQQYSLDSPTWGLMKDEVWDNYTQFMYEYDLITQTISASQQYTNQFIQG